MESMKPLAMTTKFYATISYEIHVNPSSAGALAERVAETVERFFAENPGSDAPESIDLEVGVEIVH